MTTYYLIDIHHKPPMVVLVHRDAGNAFLEGRDVAQRYADQVGRALVLAKGDDPEEPTFRPNVPNHEPVTPPGVSGVNLAPEVEVGGLEDVWNLLRKLEPTAIQLLVQVLQALGTKR